MIEFFDSIGNWIVTNLDKLTAFFSSATVIGVITAACAIYKLIVRVKNNTSKVEEVTEALTNDTELKSDVGLLKKNSEDSDKRIVYCTEKIANMESKLKEFDESVNSKLEAMLEVQNIVYSTIKDDTIRTTVNSILVQAKHKSETAKAQIEQELFELKSKYNELVQKTSEVINEAVDKVKATTGIINESVEQEPEKEEIKVTRY